MEIKANEISALIKQQIKKYKHKLELLDTGTVMSIGDGVVGNSKIDIVVFDIGSIDSAGADVGEGVAVKIDQRFGRIFCPDGTGKTELYSVSAHIADRVVGKFDA